MGMLTATELSSMTEEEFLAILSSLQDTNFNRIEEDKDTIEDIIE